jgi:glycosyltransferase involved in cell wall biosynthesis
MSGRPIRVLLVGRGVPEQGGISVFIEGLRSGPLSDDVDISFLNLTRQRDMGRGGSFTLGNLRRSLADLWSVFRRAADADIVHLHSSLAPASTMLRAGALAAAARLRRRKVVIHAHGGRLLTWIDRRGARALTKVTMAPVSTVVAVSRGVATTLADVLGSNRVTYVTNGIDPGEFTKPVDAPDRAAPDGADPRVLYVGHLSRRKGVLDLCEASRLLRARGIAHEVALAGGRPDEGTEEHELVSAALDDAVVALGTIPHERIAPIYHSARVFCLPSWWEAMPLSILEAMAAGLPVVATNVGDVPQLVVDGETGLLVEPRRPDLLAAALESLLLDPERCVAMGDAGRQRVERHFSLAESHARIADLYLALLDPTTCRGGPGD